MADLSIQSVPANSDELPDMPIEPSWIEEGTPVAHGAVHNLGPGDTAHFPLGLVAHWHVPEYIRKAFTLWTPEPFVL